MQCPYVRGEVTENVPLEETESSFPAHRLFSSREGAEKEEGAERGDRVVCVGTSMGTELLVVGTEGGRVVLLDMDNGMHIMVRDSGGKCSTMRCHQFVTEGNSFQRVYHTEENFRGMKFPWFHQNTGVLNHENHENFTQFYPTEIILYMV